MNHFEYSLIQYSGSRASGEVLNVGLVSFDAESKLLEVFIPRSLKRVGETFNERVIELKSALSQVKRSIESQNNGLYGSEFSTLDQALAVALPDSGLALRATSSKIAFKNGSVSAADLYRKLIEPYYEIEARQRREDEEVWKTFFQHARNASISHRFTEQSFGTDDSDLFVHVNHAALNGKWHVVEPVSLDYDSDDDVIGRRDKMAGHVLALNKQPEIGSVSILLGDTSVGDDRALRQFESGVQKLVPEVVFFRENQSEKLVSDLRAKLLAS